MGPTLAGIFMGYLEEKYFESNQKPLFYCRYVDDCFVLCKTEDECKEMFNTFNKLHKAITFTIEAEVNNTLPFLDVSILRQNSHFSTSIYRKATFTGQYINFRSHCTIKRKTNLIRTLCDRAMKLCSPENLTNELKSISKILQDNSYPEKLISRTINKHLARLKEQPESGPERCHIPIKLQFLGKTSYELEKELKNSIRQCYYSATPRVIFLSKPILSHCYKDPIPTLNQSKVVYRYQCCCDNSYVGQTSRRFIDRIKEHVPKCVKEFIKEPTQNFKESKTLENASKRSTIAQHLLENKECGKAHKDENFEILYKCRNLSELRVLEAVVITFLEPSLCKQREFDFTTTLF